MKLLRRCSGWRIWQRSLLAKGDSLEKLRSLAEGTGTRDQYDATQLVRRATAAFEDERRIIQLRIVLVDLLIELELESVMGGETDRLRAKAIALVDWIEKHSTTNGRPR